MTLPHEDISPHQGGGCISLASPVCGALLCFGGVIKKAARPRHRREWVRERVKELCGIFALEVCAYAVMSNHVHLVVRTRPEVAAGWSDEEVARRLVAVLSGTAGPDVGASVDEARLAALLADAERLKTCRERLGNLSWFMRGLSEQIARRANQEDSCAQGRFWEGRFKCQRWRTRERWRRAWRMWT